MGYRSDVAIEILSKDKAAFENAISEENRYWHKHLTVKAGHAQHEVYIWKDTKWYDSFSEVIEVMAAMRNLDHFAYIRIGEEDNDLEFENCLEDDMFIGTVRRLTVYEPKSKTNIVQIDDFDQTFYRWIIDE